MLGGLQNAGIGKKSAVKFRACVAEALDALDALSKDQIRNFHADMYIRIMAYRYIIVWTRWNTKYQY